MIFKDQVDTIGVLHARACALVLTIENGVKCFFTNGHFYVKWYDTIKGIAVKKA